MPSFDIVNKVDAQNLDNAINNLKREILNRYDFQGTNTSIEMMDKPLRIEVITKSELQLQQIQDSLISKMLKQKIDPKCLNATKEHYSSGDMLKKEFGIESGISKEQAKKIIKMIKEKKLKVQAQIQEDQVRVTGKKIDDLQSVIQMLKASSFEVPLQFVNMKS